MQHQSAASQTPPQAIKKDKALCMHTITVITGRAQHGRPPSRLALNLYCTCKYCSPSLSQICGRERENNRLISAAYQRDIIWEKEFAIYLQILSIERQGSGLLMYLTAIKCTNCVKPPPLATLVYHFVNRSRPLRCLLCVRRQSRWILSSLDKNFCCHCTRTTHAPFQNLNCG